MLNKGNQYPEKFGIFTIMIPVFSLQNLLIISQTCTETAFDFVVPMLNIKYS